MLAMTDDVHVFNSLEMLIISGGVPCLCIGHFSSNVSHLPPTTTITATLGPPCPPYLYHLPRRLVITPQDWPTRAIRLDQSHLELGTKYSKLALLRYDGCVEGKFRLIALAVRCT